MKFSYEYSCKSTSNWWLNAGFNNFGLKVKKIAESEKAAHVGYFNGGTDKEFVNEDREIIPSQGLSNYSNNPEMRSKEIVDK